MSLAFKAEKRDIFGKNASRRIRREGKVPAVLYGGGNRMRLPEPVQEGHLHHHENGNPGEHHLQDQL